MQILFKIKNNNFFLLQTSGGLKKIIEQNSFDEKNELYDDANKSKSELNRKTNEFKQSESRLAYELEEHKKNIDLLNLKIKEKDKIIAVSFLISIQCDLYYNLFLKGYD